MIVTGFETCAGCGYRFGFFNPRHIRTPGAGWQLTADFFAEFESRSTVTKMVDLALHHHYIPLDPTNAAGRNKT